NFSDATKAGIAVLQRLGKLKLSPEVCPWCKINPASEFDHILAKANGGKHTVFNGMFICRSCNAKKRAMSMEDWKEYVRKREGISDVEVWIEVADLTEYHLMFGRKLRKQMGWKASEPPPVEERIEPRPNPLNPINPTCVRERWDGVYEVVPLW